MAKRNLEDELLAGASKLSLIAQDYTSEEIDKTAEEIEKKNPNETASFRERQGLGTTGDTESPSVGGSSERSKTDDYDLSEYSRDLLSHLTTGKPLLSRYMGTIEQDGEGNITETQTELAEGSGEFFARDIGKTQTALGEFDPQMSEFFGGGKRVIPGRGKKSTELLTDTFGGTLKTLQTINQTSEALMQEGDLMNPLQAMAAAYAKDPENPIFRAENLFDVGLSKLIANDEKYQEKIEKKRAEILALENDIKSAPSVIPAAEDSDPYGRKSYYSAVGRQNAQQTLADKKLDLQRYQDGKLQFELQQIAAAAYREALGDPDLATSDPSKIMAEDMQDWVQHQERIRKLEPLILNKYGVLVDINEDGIIGENKVDIDNDLALAGMQALDLLVYGTAPILQARLGSDAYRDYTLWSQGTKRELTKSRTAIATTYDQYLDYGESNLNRSLVRLRSWVGDAVASSPFTLAAVGLSSVGGPGAGIAGATYMAGVQTFYESMVDPSFDDFYVGGNKIDPKEDIRMASRINDFYRSEGFEILSDDLGTYIDLPFDINNPDLGSQRIEVDVNDDKRWGYAFAKGFAEGVPEGIGASVVLRSARLGGGKHFTNWWEGFYKNFGGGAGVEFLQEGATSALEILADASIKGEHLSASEMVGRVIQGSVTGGISGGPLQSSLYAYNLSSLTQEERDALYLKNDFGRIRAVAPGVDIVKLKEKEDRLESEDITEEEARILEQEIKEDLDKITKNESDLNDLVKRVAEVDPSAAVELVAAAGELRATNSAVLERKGKNKFTETDALQSEAVGKAEKRFNDALSYAQNVAGGMGTAGLNISSEDVSQAQRLQRDLVSVEQAAEALGKPVEEVQQFVDNELSTPSTLVVAARLAQDDPSKIKLFETAEAYLAAVEEGALAERQGSLAQFMPNGEIHLAPGAAVVDVLEEVLHREIESMGLTQEDIDAMYDEISNSDNMLAKYITLLRSDQYANSEDMKEEVVVGLLREGSNIEFENENLNTLQEKLSKEFAVESFVKAASPVISDTQRYQAIASSHAQASIVDLSRRYGDEELKVLAEEIGLDLSQDLNLDQVEQLTTHAAYNAPVVVQPLNSLIPRELMTPEFEEAVLSNPAVRRDYEDGKAILTVTVRQDGTGVNEFRLRGRNGSVVFSGIEGEQLMAEILQGEEGVFALSDKGVVSTLLNKLYGPRGARTKLQKTGTKVSDYIVINVEQMGPDAIQSGSIISMRRAEGMLEILEDENTSQRKKNQIVKLVTEWLSDIEISTTRTDVITEVSGRGGRKTGTEQFQRREDAREKRRAARQEARELAEQVVEGPISPAAERKAARQTSYTEDSFPNTVFFVPNQQVWKSFDQEYLRELYILRNGNAQQKQEAAEKLLDYLANKNGLETGVTITFENRGKLLGKLEKIIPQGLLVPIEEIKKEARSESLKNFNPDETKGKIVGTIVGKRKGTTAVEFSPPATKRTEPERESDYGYGMPLENVSVHTFENPVSIEELTGESPGARDRQTRVNIPKPIVDWIGNEAVADKTEALQQGKSSRFMGMPDSPFTMTYSEEIVNSKGTYSNTILRDKRFQDGWHFWNWWVLQTGNGKVDKLGGWGYMDENGVFRRLGNIPKKKDRQTGEVLEVEPLFRSNQQRQIDRNAEEAYKKMIGREMQEAENKRIEEELREKTQDSNISYELLAGVSGLEYINLYSSFDTFATGKYLQSMSNLFDVMTQANALEEGGKIEFSPLNRPSASYQLTGDGQFDGMIDAELASIDVVTRFGGEDILQTAKLVTFFRNYARFKDPNIVYSAEKTSDGWKLSVNLKVSDANQKMVDDYNAMERPQSRQDIEYVIQSFNTGKPYQPKSSKIMPPRYYDLKQQRGSWTGTVDFMNGWLVNKYADILKFQDEQEQLRGSKLPQSQRFSEVEQLMYGKARYAMEQLDNTMQTARDFMIENGISHQDLSQFMYALHAEERNEHIAKKRPDLLDGSGMSTEQAQELIEKLDSPEMRQAAQFFYDIVQDTRQTMADKGLETLERLDAWEQLYSSYVPLQGFAEDELDPGGNSYPTGGAGMAVYGSKVKAAIGRESEAANVLANIVMQNAVTHQWAEKNTVLTSLHDMIVKNEMMEDVFSVVDNKKPLTKLDENGKQVPMTIMEMQSDPHTVPVRINGEQKFIYFNDPYYADVLNGMTMEQTNTFLRAMRAPVSWLRGVFTQWDPNFFVSNFARDMGGSLYNAAADVEGGFFDKIDGKGFQRKMIKNSFRSLNALLGEAVRGKELPPELQKYYVEWKEDGGQTGWNFIKDLKDIEAQLATNVNDLTRGKQLREKLFSSPKRFFQFVEGVNDAFENSIRLSAYMTAREQGASRQQAAVFSKNITVNFNRQGEAGPAINTMYLFFNAAVQGNMRFVDAMTTAKPIKKPDGSTREWYQRATGAQKIAAGMAGFSGMLTLLNLALSGRDEEDGELWYNKVSEYDKMRNMIICYGPNRDDFFKIPLPYGYGLFNNLGLALAEVSTGNRSVSEAMMYLGTTAFTSFSPISFGGEIDNPGTFVTRSLLPTTLKPFAEMAENRTYFGSQITGEQLPFGTPVPKSELQYRSPQQVQKFFRWMNEATGGSQFKSGWADFNPDYTYYMFEYLIGGSGDFVLSTGEQARNLFEMSKRAAQGVQGAQSLSDVVAGLQSGFGEDGEVKINYSDVPIVKRVYGEASPFYDIDKFKEQTIEIEQLYREIREDKLVQESGRYKGVQKLHDEYKEANKTLKAIRKSLREAREIDDYIERQNKITDLYEAQRRVMARWNKRYKDLRGQD